MSRHSAKRIYLVTQPAISGSVSMKQDQLALPLQGRQESLVAYRPTAGFIGRNPYLTGLGRPEACRRARPKRIMTTSPPQTVNNYARTQLGSTASANLKY